MDYSLIAIAWAVGRGLPAPLPLVFSVIGLAFLMLQLATLL